MQNVLGCCDDCPMIDKEPMEWDECQRDIMGKALGLINRQKAEIEGLQKRIVYWREDMDYHPEKERAEAIREFAERVKAKSDYCYLGHIDHLAYRISGKVLDDLVKEMTEGQNENKP